MTDSRKNYLAILLAIMLTSLHHPVEGQTLVQHQSSEPATIKLSVTVRDVRGQFVSGLKPEDFRIFEDDAPQTISTFSKEPSPLLYGLVLDNSSSFLKVIEQGIWAAQSLVKNNKPKDEAFVVRFVSSGNINVIQDFTSDASELTEAVDDLFVEKGETAFIDAVYLSTQKVAQYKQGDDSYRRALVLLTDGAERSSYYTWEDLRRLIRQENVQIFVIGLGLENLQKDGMISKGPRKRALELLTKLAAETGGLAFFPESTPELRTAVDQVSFALRNQYVIGYKSSQSKRSKGYRKIKVSIGDNPKRSEYIISTRPGYAVPGK